MCASQIAITLDNFTKIIPEIRSLMSPIIDSDVTIQKKRKAIVLTNVKTSVSGFWNTILNFNGTPSKLHTEQDFAYTLVIVPKKMGAVSKNHTNKPIFEFKFNDKNKLMIPLASGVSFVYNR